MTWVIPDSKMEELIEYLNSIGTKTKWILTTKEEKAHATR